MKESDECDKERKAGCIQKVYNCASASHFYLEMATDKIDLFIQTKSMSRKADTISSSPTKSERRELLLLSSELDQSISSILNAKTPLDSNEIPVVEYLNVLFPNGKAYLRDMN